MFSQVFNKAKGIFSKRDLPASASEDSSITVQASQSDSADSTDKSTSTITEMVTTRRSHVGSPRTTGASDSAVNGKRRIQERNTNGHSTKRRRISSEHENGLIEELSSPRQVPEDKVTVEITGVKKRRVSNGPEDSQTMTTSTPSNKLSNHIRFGSEEPAIPITTVKELEDREPAAPKEDSESDEDDDEAPEVVDNSVQLLSLKVQAQKQKEAKKRDEILQKEKRKLQDEKHKSQAKASAKPKAEKVQEKSQLQSIDMKLIPDDDIVSESTATLQGSVARESGRRALPALLPDEILNAEPVYRLPSPPPEQQQKSTRQHKFFKDVDRPAKDLHRGDVTIRVLEDKKIMLPPKSSKSGRNVKASWVAGQRSRNAPGGLKRVGGGPKSFVRR
ncbi:hypothetical protein UA08_03006 [Talaromyces atroroseus]|uniref:Immediate-early protein n=1 Tax=Talaromyces atroroseus TaxID=1441469 RepID=A0A225B6A6_TALAT|nr:hypothetical protein UA08_03006 [Talaromyces atroroseus]OKL62405.1 hypothetical protein UA08_03006 [Talaromyces atroroseus]